jgi:signal transduction histidine kinase
VTNVQTIQKELKIVQFSEVSDSVLFMEQKSENELLSMTNATVSHELRNPLNSIVA